MTSVPNDPALAGSLAAWVTAAVAGIAAPAAAMVVLAAGNDSAPMAVFGGPLLAVGLMGTGMIAASAAGRLWIGVGLSLIAGACLVLLAHALGMALPLHPLSVVLAMLVASLSFAARGALFARSAADKGWWIAVFVVGGEAAILATAVALPKSLPAWLLTLLPAQWASMAIQSALTGAGMGARGAIAALLALAGTAATTLLVARLWPRRWPYLIMFTAWLALSALVWHQSA
ncbi:MAG: hypothetical protein V2I74_12835 [Erythrobacter sp.]|jgi:hypothetical protein|nr:hypothetical protein [Erythrobacter sp.]